MYTAIFISSPLPKRRVLFRIFIRLLDFSRSANYTNELRNILIFVRYSLTSKGLNIEIPR